MAFIHTGSLAAEDTQADLGDVHNHENRAEHDEAAEAARVVGAARTHNAGDELKHARNTQNGTRDQRKCFAVLEHGDGKRHPHEHEDGGYDGKDTDHHEKQADALNNLGILSTYMSPFAFSLS